MSTPYDRVRDSVIDHLSDLWTDFEEDVRADRLDSAEVRLTRIVILTGQTSIDAAFTARRILRRNSRRPLDVDLILERLRTVNA